jgi:hypothetical protein
MTRKLEMTRKTFCSVLDTQGARKTIIISQKTRETSKNLSAIETANIGFYLTSYRRASIFW